ncbi:MAG: MotA/TolQ/ExbB proton channel family protein [Zetaproteobacteria bacterium]|nr:MotA/TolQ/ExbB proton channel family protein [Zetaproteobacteria bacterium]
MSLFVRLFFIFLALAGGMAVMPWVGAQDVQVESLQNAVAPEVVEVSSVDLGPSLLGRLFATGVVSGLVLLILMLMSVVSWAVLLAKFFFLKKVERASLEFNKTFWNTRSLSDLNSRLSEYPSSPVLELFRSGYSELTRSNKLRDVSLPADLSVKGTLDNVARSLKKTRLVERSALDRYLVFLAVSASACPFIGLFGTVWGVMVAFEGIARSGSTSLASVAPGISEALIATAFGLAAAIPAVIGYNLNAHKIRRIVQRLDGFALDFLNIVERHLIIERKQDKTSASKDTAVAENRVQES